MSIFFQPFPSPLGMWAVKTSNSPSPGHRDCGPPQQFRVRCAASPADVVGRYLPVTRDEALVRRGRGILAAPDVLAAQVVVAKTNVTEAFGPVLGKLNLDFLQDDDIRTLSFDLRNSIAGPAKVDVPREEQHEGFQDRRSGLGWRFLEASASVSMVSIQVSGRYS